MTRPFLNTILGFAEPVDDDCSLKLCSKAGGKPIWLFPHPPPPLPPRCKVCLQPQQFLIQIYCPLEEDVVGHTNAFHRMIYVAICKQASCQTHSNCASVIRVQLPRRNEYYPWDAEEEEQAEGDEEEMKGVCVVCGWGGGSKCGRCSTAYCGRICQERDWKGGHREVCGGKADDTAVLRKRMRRNRAKWAWKEVEIVTDMHPEVDEDDVDAEDGVEEIDLTELKRLEVKGSMQNAGVDELPEDLFKGRGRDECREDSMKIVRYAVDQVVRYERDGRVLWFGKEGQCELNGVDMKCECGARRVFEFEIMPQLIYFVCEDVGKGDMGEWLRREMEWNCIVVYCCERSCGNDDGDAYKMEFAWVQ